MDNKLIELTEDFLKKLEENETVQEYKELQKRILKDEELKKDISILQSLNPQDQKYQEQKHKLFANEDYKRYLALENELYFWTLEMTHSLKKITKGEKNENH